MPRKMCREAGCSTLISLDEKYCAAHTMINSKTESAKFYDKNIRDRSADKFYHSAQWKRLRTIHLKSQPLCVICSEPGTMVDHIEEISDGGCTTCLDNLQTMCEFCHRVKTAKVARERSKKKGGRV